MEKHKTFNCRKDSGAIDLSPLFKDYENKWVAIDLVGEHCMVVSSGDDPEKVLSAAIRGGHDKATLYKPTVANRYHHFRLSIS